MIERDDSSTTSSNTESKKMRIENSINDAAHPQEIPVDDEVENTSNNDQTESKEITFANAVSEDGTLKGQINSSLSKRQQKRILKKLKWEQWKPLKRQLEKSKIKIKKQEAKLNNVTLAPSRKELKTATMAKSSCKLRVALDFSYDHLMNEREMLKACKQVLHCYSINRRAKNPLQFFVTNFAGKTKEFMERHAGYENWDVNFCKEGYLDLFKKEEIVYLSSDSNNIITELDDTKVYIIGGLVDHNTHKYQSLRKANSQGIQHGKLPLLQYVEMQSRTILTIDHVFNILVLVTEGMSWKDAFLKVLPPRKHVRIKQQTQSDT